MKVIGLTGLPSVGKEAVWDFINELCLERGLKAIHISFSDEIRREATLLGVAKDKLDRESITALVGRMRLTEGFGVLARRIARRIRDEHADIYVVEAIRHPAEVEVLRESYPMSFVLAAVVAELETIAQRLIERARIDESPAALKSMDRAVELLERELRGNGGVTIDVGKCIKMADVVIHNDGSLADLREDVRRTFEPMIGRAATGRTRRGGTAGTE